tara:strand:- start:32211 stop:32873 length:663 start_codon:yes stop_codon:yes gene_type:complete
VVADVPKSLAQVDERPFITHLITHWAEQRVTDFVFLLHYEARQIELVLGQLADDPKFSDVHFRTVIESKPLGTGGAILNALGYLEVTDSFLVVNADTWLGSGIEILSRSLPCSLAAVKVPNTQRYGSLSFKGPKISRFEEKSKSFGAGYVNSGLYHLSPEIFNRFEDGAKFSLEEDVFPELVSRRKLGFVKLGCSFIDIGIPEDYLKFCNWIELGRRHEL